MRCVGLGYRGLHTLYGQCDQRFLAGLLGDTGSWVQLKETNEDTIHCTIINVCKSINIHQWLSPSYPYGSTLLIFYSMPYRMGIPGLYSPILLVIHVWYAS